MLHITERHYEHLMNKILKSVGLLEIKNVFLYIRIYHLSLSLLVRNIIAHFELVSEWLAVPVIFTRAQVKTDDRTASSTLPMPQGDRARDKEQGTGCEKGRSWTGNVTWPITLFSLHISKKTGAKR